jgi:uncharacterized membrane protein
VASTLRCVQLRTLHTSTQRRLFAVATLGALSAFGLTLMLVRIPWAGANDYDNLAWNLLLAWVPFVVALGVYALYGRGVSPQRLAPAVLLWLVFLPNAPYLVTDFVYLGEFRDIPLWYDTVMLTTFAGVGLLLGFLSLYLMHTVARRAFGPTAGWIAVTVVLAVAGFGVYLGRFVRFNSWDIVTHPSLLAGDLWQGASNPLGHPWAIAASAVLGVLLMGGYLVAYRLVAVATSRLDRLPDTRA